MMVDLTEEEIAALRAYHDEKAREHRRRTYDLTDIATANSGVALKQTAEAETELARYMVSDVGAPLMINDLSANGVSFGRYDFVASQSAEIVIRKSGGIVNVSRRIRSVDADGNMIPT